MIVRLSHCDVSIRMHECTHMHACMQTHTHTQAWMPTHMHICMHVAVCVHTSTYKKEKMKEEREADMKTKTTTTYYQMEKLIYWQPKTDKYGDRDGKTGLQPAVRQTSSFLQRWMFMGFSSSSSKALHRVRSLSSSRWMWYTSRLQQSHKHPSTAPTRFVIMGFWTLYYVTHRSNPSCKFHNRPSTLSFYSFALFSFFELRLVLWGRRSWRSCSLLLV